MSTRRKDTRRRKGRAIRDLPTNHPPYPDYPTVATQTPDQLWSRLVSDGVMRIPTPIGWLVAALNAIATTKRTDVETLFVELNDEVASMAGRPLTIEPGRL